MELARWLIVAALCLQGGVQCRGQDQYDVVWTSPSENAHGSMPLGNGDIGLNAWVEPEGDLIFYISKTDTWSDNGRLLKVGRVRISLDPPPPMDEFQQRLSLRDGTMVVHHGRGNEMVTTRLWVDANHPLIHITIDGSLARTVTASIELWRTQPQAYPAADTSDLLEDRSKPNRLHEEIIVEPDTVISEMSNRVGWYHHNIKSVGPDLIAQLQGLSDYFKGRPDPLLHRIFGAVITAADGRKIDDTHLQSPSGENHCFSICVLTQHPSSPDRWRASIDDLLAEADRESFRQRRVEHEEWWRQFWQRSWIHVSGGAPRCIVPRNEHPVRIGIDQHGQNRFVGDIGRVTILPRAAGDSDIRKLSAITVDDPLPDMDGMLYRGRPAAPLSIDDSQSWTFQDGLTFEAWIRPGHLPPGGGRIVDRTTPGASDGLLFDTYPGRSLRLIVGDSIVSRENVLPEGKWSHVAATVDPSAGRLAIFLNGDVIISRNVDIADDTTVVSRAYALQRFITACAGRGAYPIKFNGSIFTVPFEGKFGDADYRRWGPGYWWQNTRLPYLSMCAGGDFEMMRPLFRMYADDLLPLHMFRTQRYTGHYGAFIPECIYFWGPIFTSTYGWTPFEERGEDKLQDSGWHKREWVAGPELVWMMLDYYEHTLDESFARETLLPFAHEILTFFDQHYDTDASGRLVMDPSQAVETWWDCTNPMPEVAGLHAVTARLLSLPSHLSTSDERTFWAEFRSKLPPLPTREADGVEMLAPAERFDEKRNIENPELYAVFPFRLVSFEKSNAQLGIEALRHRWDKGNFGWRQDDLFMACLGLAEEARDYLVGRARNKHSLSRFPAFWGPNYDWVPDQDHGGVLMRTLQSMLMQTDGKRIHLLPAWPKGWDADFRLHAPYQTIVSGTIRNGRLEALEVQPESRAKDVFVHEPTAGSSKAVPRDNSD